MVSVDTETRQISNWYMVYCT